MMNVKITDITNAELKKELVKVSLSAHSEQYVPDTIIQIKDGLEVFLMVFKQRSHFHNSFNGIVVFWTKDKGGVGQKKFCDYIGPIKTISAEVSGKIMNVDVAHLEPYSNGTYDKVEHYSVDIA